MSREAKLRIKLFVEGDTEENYFSKLRKNKNVEIIYKEVNMGGGGYTSFLKEIKKESHVGYIAFFIVVDLDRFILEPDQKKSFEDLLNFCRTKSKNGPIPYFLIVNNRDFEYFACVHCAKYNSGDTTNHITKIFNYQDLDKFKSDKKIYEFLNTNGRSFGNAIRKIRERTPYISNRYKKVTKKLDISIKIEKTIVTEEAGSYYHSNLYELFEIIGVEG